MKKTKKAPPWRRMGLGGEFPDPDKEMTCLFDQRKGGMDEDRGLG